MAEKNVFRVENKYLADVATAAKLNAVVRAVMPKDRETGSAGYMVRSVYFDTVYDNDYRDKVDGLESRKKVRLRIYSPDDPTAKLELKEKRGINQRKRSFSMGRRDAEALIQGDYDVLRKYDSEFMASMYLMMKKAQYIPRTIVQFNRLAYMLTSNETRVTFDTKLQASESDFSLFSGKLPLYPILYPTIVEVKYNRFLLEYVKDVLSPLNQLPTANSKYILARQISYY